MNTMRSATLKHAFARSWAAFKRGTAQAKDERKSAKVRSLEPPPEIEPIRWWGVLLSLAFFVFLAWVLDLFSWNGWPAVGQWIAVTAVSLWDGIFTIPLAFWLIVGGLWMLSKIEGAAVNRWEQQQEMLGRISGQLETIGWHLRAPAQMAELNAEPLATGVEADEWDGE